MIVSFLILTELGVPLGLAYLTGYFHLWSTLIVFCSYYFLVLLIVREWIIYHDVEPILPPFLTRNIPGLEHQNTKRWFVAVPHGYFADALFFDFFLSNPAPTDNYAPIFFIASELYALPLVSLLATARGGRPVSVEIAHKLAGTNNPKQRLIGLLPGAAKEMQLVHRNDEHQIHCHEHKGFLNLVLESKAQYLFVAIVNSTHKMGVGYPSIKWLQDISYKLVGTGFPVWFVGLPYASRHSYLSCKKITLTESNTKELLENAYADASTPSPDSGIISHCYQTRKERKEQ